MAEYIEREKAFKLIKEQKEKETGAYSKGRNKGLIIAGSIINNKEVLPTADVAEVKHGYNKTSMHPVDEFWCSECGFCCADYTETKYDADGDYTYSCECEFDYCPRCGAKMDGKGDT